MTAELRHRALAGVRWTSIGSLVHVGLQLGQIAILARILSPGDFGAMAIVVALLGFLQLLAGLGIGAAIIHERDIDAAQRSSLYWLSVAAGAALTLIVLALSPLVASIYEVPTLQSLLGFAGLHLLASGTWQALRFFAEKDLRFRPVIAVEVAGAAAAAAAAVGMAWGGWGVHSLVGGLLAGSLASAALAWPVLARGWRPQLRLRVGEVSRFLRFGGYVMASEMVNSAASQVDVLLGARVMGTPSIAFYNLPKSLCLQVAGTINPIVTRVGFPVMSLAQGDVKLLQRIYLHTLRMTASANFPAYTALWLFSEEVIHLLLGRQWDAAVPVLGVLAVWGALRSAVSPVGSLLMASGRARLNFAWNLSWLLILPPVVWGAAQHGPTALAGALASVMAAAFVPAWRLLVKPVCQATLGQYAAQLALPLALAMAAGAVAYFAALPFTGAVPRLIAGLSSGAAAYLALCVWFNSVWVDALRDALTGRRPVHDPVHERG